MNKEIGIHLYINIKNFNNVVITEEAKIGKVNHSIHALDTLFTSIERFGEAKYKDSFVVEKITGSRLHIYFSSKDDDAIEMMLNVASYAYAISLRINRDISKYNALTDFKLQMGADVGDFFVYEFNYSENESNDIESEVTTIGYPANYAAKLQGLAETSNICISEALYKLIDDDIRKGFQKKRDSSLRKYCQSVYYSMHVRKIEANYKIDDEMKAVADYAGKANLTDMQFPVPDKLISFHDLSKVKGKAVEGVPLFADIRGFTSKFYADGSNLEEMAIKTQAVLETMYRVVTLNGGVHVQFQGDREMALFHDVGEDKCIEKAIIAGMRMIDKVSDIKLDIHLGTGADYGKMYAAKIGARGEKDNILIGETVINSDRLEDEKAKENQIAISSKIYDELVNMDSNLVTFFRRGTGDVYIATVGYRDYLRKSANMRNIKDTKNHSYNGAWNE